MLSDPAFVARRDAIRQEIEEEMIRITTEQERGINSDENERSEHKHIAEEEKEDCMGEADISGGQSNASAEEDDPEASCVLRIGISCAMGRHRSVAMVEELAKASWPNWRIEVQHRDLLQKRGAGTKTGGKGKGKGSRGSRGGGMSSYLEDD